MSSKLSSDALLAFEAALVRVVLTTILEATPLRGRPPARGFVVAALSGSLRNDVVGADAHRLATFAILGAYGYDRVREIVDALVAADLVQVVKNHRGLILSPEGRTFVEKSAAPRPLGILRRYRAGRAREEDTPEYRIFSEATLRELAAAAPATPEALERVPGLGTKRLELHGAELLRIVAEHAPIMERLASDAPRPGDEVDAPPVEPAAVAAPGA